MLSSNAIEQAASTSSRNTQMARWSESRPMNKGIFKKPRKIRVEVPHTGNMNDFNGMRNRINALTSSNFEEHARNISTKSITTTRSSMKQKTTVLTGSLGSRKPRKAHFETTENFVEEQPRDVNFSEDIQTGREAHCRQLAIENMTGGGITGNTA